MKLTDLDPVWLGLEGDHVGIMFRCPHCRETWLSCFWVGMPIWGEEIAAPRSWSGQFGYIREALDRLKLEGIEENAVVPCSAGLAWNRTGDTFDNLTLTPSLDASASGHWHGFITNGAIT